MNNCSRYTYKAKRKDNGEWVYGNFINPKYIVEQLTYVSSMQFIADCQTKSIEGVIYEIIPETLSQCTGLQDIDGNYIFENDIISSNANLGYGKRQKKVEIISQVIYLILNDKTMRGLDTNQCSMFTTKQLNKEQEYTNMDWSVFFNCKVIGNKFDKEFDTDE